MKQLVYLINVNLSTGLITTLLKFNNTITSLSSHGEEICTFEFLEQNDYL